MPPPLKASLGKVPKGFGLVLPKSTKGRRLLQAQGSTAVNGAAPTGAQASGIPATALANNGLLPLITEVNSSFLVPLKVAAGISSSFLAQGLAPAESDALKELTGTEELE